MSIKNKQHQEVKRLKAIQLRKVEKMSKSQAKKYLGEKAYEAFLITGKILTNKEINKMLDA